jgi:hypothetical protein
MKVLILFCIILYYSLLFLVHTLDLRNVHDVYHHPLLFFSTSLLRLFVKRVSKCKQLLQNIQRRL